MVAFPNPFKKFKPPLSKERIDTIKSGLVSVAGGFVMEGKSPDESLTELFDDVQAQGIFPDQKAFVDLVPKTSIRNIRREYTIARRDPHLDLREFLLQHYYEPDTGQVTSYTVSSDISARQHVKQLWPVLVRTNRRSRGSLLMLPYPYVVPGGRFREQFYWDSYFVMLGLVADAEWQLLDGMMKNYAYMIRKFGYIPTANRTYLTSRSQPPFFSHMVELLAQHQNPRDVYLEYMPSLIAEYRFWIKKRRYLQNQGKSQAYLRAVKMPNGDILTRYYDGKHTPRPEMAREDMTTAIGAEGEAQHKLFLDLRACAESGWDFSTRWFADERNLRSINTTDIVPVDLNCLLYHMEITIATACDYAKQKRIAEKFRARALRRQASITEYMWDEQQQFFYDYNFRTGARTQSETLAAVFPLYVGVATSAQAAAVAVKLEKDFLKPGGVVTTLRQTGQQWDAPNGWAPLQWATIMGLRRYGYDTLADRVRNAWIDNVETVFKRERKMIEKYDVTVVGGTGGGGEYPLQDGFGWTNGVYAVLKDEQLPS